MTTVLDIRPNEVSLTPTGAAELPVLARLYVQMYEVHGVPLTTEAASAKLAKMLQAPSQHGLLFEHGDQPIGFIIWAELGDHVFIRDYLIDTAYRGRGLGAALFTRLRSESLPSKLPIRLEASADHSRRF